MKYMIDFDRMLLIGLGYFNTEEEALAWIEESVIEEEWASHKWPGNFESYKRLYKPIPIYPVGDERLDTHRYGRYSGGQR